MILKYRSSSYCVLTKYYSDREDHIFYVKLVYGLLTTKNLDPVTLDKFAEVMCVLTKKWHLLPRADLTLDWVPLFELYHFWEDSSVSMRGLVLAPADFKTELCNVIQCCRGYFSDESTGEMLERWAPMLCPGDRWVVESKHVRELSQINVVEMLSY